MPIKRCSEQKHKTLEEFYAEFLPEKNQFWVDVGTSMLRCIKLIDETFKETMIYGLTSHSALIFLAQDNSESDSFVTIHSSCDDFHIEYLMVKNNRPWHNATVKGEAKSLDELKTLIIIAMAESQGWNGSLELKTLYKSVQPK